MRPFCQHPDRDEPRLVCGYPIPCPHHTLEVDASFMDDVDVAHDAVLDGRGADARRIIKQAIATKVRVPGKTE